MCHLQDGGDPANEVSPRDIVYMLPADEAGPGGCEPMQLAGAAGSQSMHEDCFRAFHAHWRAVCLHSLERKCSCQYRLQFS